LKGDANVLTKGHIIGGLKGQADGKLSVIADLEEWKTGNTYAQNPSTRHNHSCKIFYGNS